jgi:hypothetical protein
MLLPRPLNFYKYITETKDVLFVLFGFHINMDVSHINSKKGKTKMNLKNQINQEVKSDECTESKKNQLNQEKEDK